MDVKLGKKLGVVHDRRTLMAKAILASDDVRVPQAHRLAKSLKRVPMFANDEFGDCVFASQGHAIVTWEKASSQRDLAVSTEDILQEYTDVTGFRPDNPSSDNGAYELDGLNNFRQNGIGRQKDGSPHKIYAFAAVEWTNHEEVKLASYVFGGVKVCAGLPLAASDQLRRGQDWDVTEGTRARWGSWGGHSLYSYGYNPYGLYLWTWGKSQFATWAWVDKYVDESYALVSPDYIRKGGTTPQGFDRLKLDRFLASL